MIVNDPPGSTVSGAVACHVVSIDVDCGPESDVSGYAVHGNVTGVSTVLAPALGPETPGMSPPVASKKAAPATDILRRSAMVPPGSASATGRIRPQRERYTAALVVSRDVTPSHLVAA